ncbi:MAG: hypoxanthine phosphoribosyltransferase [Cyclobacteriaceae bacterium]
MSLNSSELELLGKRFDTYITHEEIKTVVKRLALKINQDYEGREVVLLGVLDGVVVFLADLMRELQIELSIELIKLKSYSGTESTGSVKEFIGLSQSLENKHVLIVEDIIDTGETLQYLLQQLEKEQAGSVEIVTLLLKEEVFCEKFPIKYVGKKIENKFVLGFGMDFDGWGRQLPDIYALKGQ